MSHTNEKEREEANMALLYQGMSTTTTSLLDQEDAQRKELMDALVRDSTPSNAPVVKVLTNVQGTNNSYFLTTCPKLERIKLSINSKLFSYL